MRTPEENTNQSSSNDLANQLDNALNNDRQQSTARPAGDESEARPSISRARHRRVSVDEGGDSFRSKLAAINEHIKADPAADGFGQSWDLVPILASQNSLNFDGAAYVVLFDNVSNGRTEQMAYFYTMMFEDAGALLQPRTERNQLTGETMQIPVMAGSQYDAIYIRAVIKTIARKFNLPEKNVRNAGGMAVPSFTQMTSLAIRDLLLNADNAVSARANIDSGYQMEDAIGMADIGPKDQTFLRFDFNQSQTLQFDNVPNRTDVQVTLSKRSGSQGQTSRDETMLKVNAMLIAQYNEPNKQPQYNEYNQPVMPSTQVYSPLLVITGSESGRALNHVESLEQRLLAIATAMYLNRNANWINILTPKKGKEDLTDIGAFNIDFVRNMKGHPAFAQAEQAGKFNPEKVDTHGPSFGQAEVFQYISKMFFPNLTIAMDVLQGGEKSWIDNLILLASMAPNATIDITDEDNPVARANRQIISSMNLTSKGKFKELLEEGFGKFRLGQPLVINDGILYPAGYYNFADERRDIRDFSLLEILNVAGNEQYEWVERWKRATSPNWNYDNNFRIVEMLTILTKFAPGFKHTGYYSRPIINPNLLATYMAALARAGLAPGLGNFTSTFNENSYGQSTAAQFSLGADISYGQQQGSPAQGNQQTSNWFFSN